MPQDHYLRNLNPGDPLEVSVRCDWGQTRSEGVDVFVPFIIHSAGSERAPEQAGSSRSMSRLRSFRRFSLPRPLQLQHAHG